MKTVSNYILFQPNPDWDMVELGSTGTKLQVPTEYNPETQSRAASYDKEKHACTSGVVIAVPERIEYEAKSEAQEPFPWITEMELRPGDTIIFNYLQELHAVADGRKNEDGSTFMRYEMVICAIRKVTRMTITQDFFGNKINATPSEDIGTIIQPVNGYIIVEALEEENLKTKLIIPKMLQRRKSLMKGRIRYIGTPLDGYRNYPEYGADEDELQVDDEIIFHNSNAVKLQTEMHQIIEKGKILYQMQRFHIDLYRRNIEGWHPWKPCSKRILVKYNEKQTVFNGNSGIAIPDSLQKFPEHGRAVMIGRNIDGVDVNDTVRFFKGFGTPVTLDNEEYIVLKEWEIACTLNKENEANKRYPNLA